jgi:cellulose synthase (UDP-forming)
MLHERGWKSIFIPKTLAVGDAPETIEAYTKQQQRWATGGFEILFTHNPFSPKRKLTLDQRFMYFVTASFYLTGIAPGILLFVPALEVFFDLHPVNLQVGVWTWLLFYAGFYVLQILLAALTLGTFRWEVLLLAANSFPIYVRAFKNAFIGVDTKWHVTGATKKSSAFNFIIPQVLIFVFLLGVAIVSVWRDLTLGQLNVATFWSVVNTLAVGAFIGVGFHEAREVQGVADPTDVDLASALVDDVAPVTLDRDEIANARRKVELLASADADANLEALESAPIEPEPEQPVPAATLTVAPAADTAASPPRRAADPADVL